MSDSQNDSFQRALDEARRKDRAPNEGSSLRRPSVRAHVDFGPQPGSGGEARFGLALDWTDEPGEPLAPIAPGAAPKAALSGADTAAEIADELGLGETLAADKLASRWRSFVWRNHPDRQPIDAREQANARVAIANALYEQARRRLA